MGVPKGSIIAVSAPSGAGKTTLLDHVREVVPSIVYSISATTRKPRAHEVDGEHYFFVSPEAFREMIDHDELIEWQEVHGNMYGTPRSFIEQIMSRGKHVVLDIDVFGKKKLDRAFPETQGILILPPSMQELQERLRSRGTDDDHIIQTRLRNAEVEMDFAKAHGRYEYTIVNSDLDAAKSRIVSIVEEIIGSAR